MEASNDDKKSQTVDKVPSTMAQTEDTNTNNQGEGDDFINQGLQRWEEAREQWKKTDTSDSTPRGAVPVDVDEIIDLIFSQRWRNPDDNKGSFPQPVPLPQMVDILVDLWEAEGLDI